MDGVGRGTYNRISNDVSSDASLEATLGDVQPVNFDSSHGTSSDASLEATLDGVRDDFENRKSYDVSSDTSSNIISNSDPKVNIKKLSTRQELHNKKIEVIKKTEVRKQGTTENGVAQNSRSVDISIADLMQKVKCKKIGVLPEGSTPFDLAYSVSHFKAEVIGNHCDELGICRFTF